MTDKVQKIREEVERLKEETSIGLSEYENGIEQGRMEIINALSLFLDSMQEAPVSEELEEAIGQSFIYHDNHGDDFRSDKQIETAYRYGFESGAKWQKEKDDEEKVLTYKHGYEDSKKQMMAKAIDAHCFGFQGSALFSFKLPADNYLVGSEVKVIVIKED